MRKLFSRETENSDMADTGDAAAESAAAPTPDIKIPQADQNVEPETSVSGQRADTQQLGSIQSKVIQRVLPVVALPLLLLGLVAVAAIAVIQNRTATEVDAAGELLTEQVVEDAVNRSADGAARELGRYINGWVAQLDDVSGRRDVGLAIAEGNDTVRGLSLQRVETNEELAAGLTGQPPLVDRLFIRALAEELTDTYAIPEISLYSQTGIALGDSSGRPPRVYRDAEWFQQAMTDGENIDPIVTDEDGETFFQISTRASVFTETNVVGVVRVRVPMTSLQTLLDEVVTDAAVEGIVIDRLDSVLVADTVHGHDPALLYNSSTISGSSTVNLALMEPGTVQDEERLTSARNFQGVGGAAAESFPWVLQTYQPTDVATAPLLRIQQVSEDAAQTRDIIMFGVLALTIASLWVGYRASRSLAARITGPVRALSDQADHAANEGIPAIVDAAQQSAEELPELAKFEVDTNDELTVLASSLNVMQDAALSLAAEQAKLRRTNVAHTFVSLGRRNQNLLNRQLEFIDELERQENDPDSLENLFRLDHLATRMRRNAENLLVLAGEQTPRRWAKPIAVRDVLRAASSEIGDYKRVRLGEIDNATVSGNLATDLSHLVAELLENAGAFSPPGSPIDVLGQKTSSHYRLAIIDQGIGMDERALHEANSRLANPVDFADAPSAYLGLFVVGHLARQLNITVRLANSEPVNLAGGNTGGGGTIAFIDLPVSLLSSESATEIDVATRGAARADEVAAQRQAAPPEQTAAPAAEAPPSVPVFTPEPTEATPAGFPKRVAPMVANRTDVPEPALAASTDETVTIQPPVTDGTTDAGFPKRRGADVAAVREQVQRLDTPAAAPETQPVVPDTTAAGFPKRRSAEVETPPVPVATEPAPVVESQRSPESVSAALSSFRAAVAKGRQDSQQTTPAPSDSPAPAAVAVAPAVDVPAVEGAPVPPALPVQPTNTNSPTPGSPS